MSKRKDVDAAFRAGESCVDSIEHAWSLGRIAGLREAAKIATDVYVDYDYHGHEEAKLIEDAQDECARCIRQRARELAKKARAK